MPIESNATRQSLESYRDTLIKRRGDVVAMLKSYPVVLTGTGIRFVFDSEGSIDDALRNVCASLELARRG